MPATVFAIGERSSELVMAPRTPVARPMMTIRALRVMAKATKL
jgi:hypothetical protein